jgi:hypothetical protein
MKKLIFNKKQKKTKKNKKNRDKNRVFFCIKSSIFSVGFVYYKGDNKFDILFFLQLKI